VLAEASAQGNFALPPALRLIIMGGEQADLGRLRQWQAQHGARVRLVNLYGPTETTIAATAEVVPLAISDTQPDTAIGRGLGNLQVYVLDAQMQPAPDGIAGELYIGGAQLARGYLHQPGSTAARFVPDPFSREPGARLYRTGDRVRVWHDGRLLFLGRLDQQVKLRGYRIELGEIAAVLRAHGAVREAVVVVRDEQLVAYVVEEPSTLYPAPNESQAGPSLGARFSVLGSALRAFLAERLPAYMLPAAIVVLDALPLTANDKLDRAALPAPTAAAFAVQQALVAPRDEVERWLAQLWAELLGRQEVGVTDNFFALGGHSLLAVRLLAQIQQQIGRAIPLVTLVQSPTIAQLAAHLREQRADGPWSPLVPLQAQGQQRPLFLVHPIGGTVLCYAELARLLGPEQPVYGLQAWGMEPDQVPHQSLAAMVDDYVAAIRQVQPHGPYRLGGWSFGGVVAFEIAVQLQRQDETVDLLALIDSGLPAPDEDAPDETAMLLAFLQDLGGTIGTSLGITQADLARLTADQQLAYVLARAQQQKVLPAGMDRDQLQRLAAVFSANLKLLASYQPTPTPLPVTLLLAEATAQHVDLMAAWRALTTVVAGYVVPGTHYTLLRPPHVHMLADWLGAQLSAG
ncbi:MAG TPA: alpha/beta fold hydrolase, partial [Herpetosiphonaceae bacterium]